MAAELGSRGSQLQLQLQVDLAVAVGSGHATVTDFHRWRLLPTHMSTQPARWNAMNDSPHYQT